MPAYSSRAEIDEAHEVLFKTFASGRTKSLAWRRWQLKQIWWLLADNEEQLLAAIKEDLGRHVQESLVGDFGLVQTDILEHLKNLEKWTSTKSVDANFMVRMVMGGKIRKEPLGVSLIIAAWNYPVMLLLQPLVAAVAAGCCALLKPSEIVPATQNVLAELVPKYLDQSAIRVVTGGPGEMSYILEKRFNQIFFTGSTPVAKIIAAAAAKHLTPVVLELGGQGPAIVTKSADIELAARRITFAKFMNAGQICLSVNHVLAEPEIADRLVERMKYWNEQYVSNGGTEDMTRIVSDRQFSRLNNLLEKTKGDIVYTGDRDPKDKYFHPTIVDGVTMDDSLMSEELFGPIAPVMRVSVDEAIATVNRLPHSLALYVFGRDQGVIDKVLNNTLSGGVCINNVLVHTAIPAPFGGVGDSGMGAYHGPYGLDCFSHKRTVAHPASFVDKVMNVYYAPYNKKKDDFFRVKNALGFKRGETLEDQKKGTPWFRRFSMVAVILAVAGYVFANKVPKMPK